MNPEMYTKLKTVVAPNELDETTTDPVKSHYTKKRVTIAERFIFSKRHQLENETIEDYVKELRKLASTCEFGSFLDEAVRDKFVFGMKDEILQAALLKEDLTFDDAYRYALTMEVSPTLQQDRIENNETYNDKNHNGNEEVKLEIGDCEDFNFILDVKEEFQNMGFKGEVEAQQEFLYLPGEPINSLPFDADCEKEFEVLSTQSRKKEFICEFCQNVFSNNAHLTRHLRSHTGEKPYSCMTCKESFTRREGLQRHIQKSSGCEDYDIQKLQLQSIVKAKRKVEHICQYCSWSFHKKSHLQRHLRTHTGEKPYVCEICKNSFSRSERLRQHLLTHGNEYYCDQLLNKKSKSLKTAAVKKKFACQDCGQVFLKRTDLQKHLRNDTGSCKFEEEMKLDEDFETSPFDSINVRMFGQETKKIDTNQVPELFKCYVCNYTTAIKNHMRGHVKIHSRIKPFLCHICDYKTTRNNYLQVHIRRHDGIKKFACSICDFKTVSQSNLKRHTKIHTGEKTHICEICGYKTNSGSWLRVHSRIHTGEKPYACNICNYRSAERTALRNHVRIHTGEKPFCCKFCDYRAAQRTGLTYHLKSHKIEAKVQTENIYTLSTTQID